MNNKNNNIDISLMRYIPKEYKSLVEYIYKGRTEYNEITRRNNNIIVVKFKDEDDEREFQNASYMYNLLKEFGRE